MTSVSIVLVDDHAIVRDGLRALLEKQSGMQVVAEAEDGKAAIKAVLTLQPDVVIMDASMPGLNGIEATRQINAKLPQVHIICLSMHAENRFVSAMLEAGASAYLLKDCAGEELVRAIHAVQQGHIYISPSIGHVVAEHFKAGHEYSENSVFDTLSSKERTVLQLLAEGHTTREIGERLNISVKTVASHREHLMQKLDINSIAGLTKYAIRQGLTTLEN